MKDSGVEWIGEIPEHWEVKRLGWLCQTSRDINHEMPISVDEGIPFLSAKDIAKNLRNDEEFYVYCSKISKNNYTIAFKFFLLQGC